MNDTSPSTSRIVFISAIFGILSLIVAKFGLSFGFFGALVIGLIVAAIVWWILWMGWKTPNAPSTVSAVPPQATSVASAPAAAPVAATSTPVTMTPVAPAPVENTPETPTKTTEPVTIAKPAAKPATAKTATKPAAAKKVVKPAAAKVAAKTTTTKVAAVKAVKPATGKAIKPAVLTEARDGGPDNLKMIKGVGPVLEKALHASGVFHFDQVAAWKKADATWFDDNVKGANGRVLRDEWVKQAKILAKGGTTDFSSKVKKGGVY
ncbi:NADH:quinone oxidoreductase [Yoonia sp. MH D7]